MDRRPTRPLLRSRTTLSKSNQEFTNWLWPTKKEWGSSRRWLNFSRNSPRSHQKETTTPFWSLFSRSLKSWFGNISPSRTSSNTGRTRKIRYPWSTSRSCSPTPKSKACSTSWSSYWSIATRGWPSPRQATPPHEWHHTTTISTEFTPLSATLTTTPNGWTSCIPTGSTTSSSSKSRPSGGTYSKNRRPRSPPDWSSSSF